MLLACDGHIAPGPAGDDAGADAREDVAPSADATTDAPPDVPLTCGVDDAGCSTVMGPTPMRRLTNHEYDNTVRDLLGDHTGPSSHFPPDTLVDGFDNNTEALTVSADIASAYLTVADGLAGTYVRNPTALFRALSCDVASQGESTCVTRFIADFGRRAFRRPLRGNEATRLRAIYAANRGADVASGLRAVVTAALVSPNFLYRVEVGNPFPPGATTVPLTPYETASRLSYLLWGSMPDEPLFAAAAAGALETPAQLAAQARRMLADPRAHDAAAYFYDHWLELTNLDAVDGLSDAQRGAMEASTRASFDDALWAGEGRFETLLTAPVAFVNQTLAPLYGLTGVTGATLRRVDTDPTQRTGVLGLPSVLATHGRDGLGPIFRGRLVREQFFCQELPDPPPDVPAAPAPVAGQSIRERLAQHRSSSSSCPACHSQMDPIGFGLENFDPVGAYRTVDNGLPVDASGEITMTDDADGTFVGEPALAQRLAGSAQVRACIVTHWFRYAHGRRETDDDRAERDGVGGAFDSAGHDLRELLVAFTQSPAFRLRRATTR